MATTAVYSLYWDDVQTLVCTVRAHENQVIS